jgi:aminoglycoside phosphotransferase family enzyme/predicted kinase
MPSANPSAPATDGIDVQALRARLQACTGEPVTLVETHLSWILLTSDLAYKLKKPVRLPFVDCRTVAAREHLCREELRLNHRLAARLYLGVLPVRGTPAAPCIGGAGAPVDFVVCMRRFPPGALLGEMLQAGRLRATDLASFARHLARFHAEAAVSAAGSVHGTPEQIRAAVGGVLDPLQAAQGAGVVAGLRRWADAQARALEPVWQQRRREGHVRACHGDLHLDNLVLLDGEVVAFDCVEFDERLRTTDTVADIAFTTMDLKARGRPDLAHALLDDYLQASGDYAGVAVLRFYEVYRALVRAMVDGLRHACGAAAGQDSPYLPWARQATDATRQAPPLVLMHGLSGSGKSTVARALVEQGGAIRLRSDVERKRLHGLDALASSAGAGQAIYGAGSSERTYAHLLQLARQLLASGHAVVVDAAFLEHAQREAFGALAAELQLPLTVVDCGAPAAVLRARLQARAAAGADPSEADAGVLERQMARRQELTPHERACAVRVAADAPFDAAALWQRIVQPRP